jgi:hypothetical protein
LDPIDEQNRPWGAYTLIRYEQATHPGRKIVLLCCNPDHTQLHGFKNVFYSPGDVWMTPDAYAGTSRVVARSFLDPTTVGDIGLFVEAK